MRRQWGIWAAGFVAIVGLAGLIRGAIPQQQAAAPATPAGPPIVVSGAWVREPASPDVAAGYFTVYNTSASPDTLVAVNTGAGRTAVLHAETNGSMTVDKDGLLIPPHSSVSLSPGKGHVMIEGLFGPLKPGQSVNMELQFLHAGPLVVLAPVIAIGAPAPTSTRSPR